MVTRIVHISDLHFPSRDRAVARRLHDAIVQMRPHVLAVTGDIANYPSLWWPFGRGAWAAALGWLRELAADIERQSGAPAVLLMVPGNHDVLLSGLTGWCWPAGRAFTMCFREWRRDQVFYQPRANVTFLLLDTNPRTAIFSAEGKAFAGRLKALRRAMDAHPDAARIGTSTKILLMHHHPLPVPFQGSDWLLQTRRVDRLLRAVAEMKIDVIVHGHKHRATWSHLRIGGTSVEPFFIEVLGAGSAMKAGDHDPRGHNFNVIDVAPAGARHVRQFFKHPDADRFAETAASAAEDGLSRLIRSRFRQPYRARRLTWKVQADEEGDARNELAFEAPANRGGRARVLGRKLHAQLVRDEHPRGRRARPGRSGLRLGRSAADRCGRRAVLRCDVSAGVPFRRGPARGPRADRRRRHGARTADA